MVKLLRRKRKDDAFLFRLYQQEKSATLSLCGLPKEAIAALVGRQVEIHLAAIAATNGEEWIVVDQAGQPIGHVVLIREPPDRLNLVGITLLQENRGKGIGRAVIERILEFAVFEDRHVWLSVLQNNPALRLYQRVEFRQLCTDGVVITMKYESSV